MMHLTFSEKLRAIEHFSGEESVMRKIASVTIMELSREFDRHVRAQDWLFERFHDEYANFIVETPEDSIKEFLLSRPSLGDGLYEGKGRAGE